MIKKYEIEYFCLKLFLLMILQSCSEKNEQPVPAPPSNLIAVSVSRSQVELSWTDHSTNESGFKIERKTTVDNYSVIGETSSEVTSYTDKDLVENTEYFYRIYSFNSTGKSVTYSNEASAITKTLPVLTTTTISSIMHFTAMSGGNITFDGGSNVTSRGVVWSTNPNPTASLSTKTSDGVGDGIFESSLTSLTPNTSYHVRAYAVNEFGTAYGNELIFNTNEIEYYVSVSASGHSLALKSDGTLWAWGYNHYGQLGDGTNTDRNTPVQIGSGYAAISAGGAHTLALKVDGTLWAWGDNAGGQLGDGTNESRNLPTEIGSGYSVISAGSGHSMALKTDGTLWTWGYNNQGRLGDGTIINSNTPIQIGVGYSSISAGGSHSLALKVDGTLWAWGNNEFGQLADGTNENRYTPVQIGSGYVGIAAGGIHTLALKVDGKLYGAGYNSYGQLGDNSNVHRAELTYIGEGYSSVSAGAIHSLLIKNDGTLWACGKNAFGALGDGTNDDKLMPVQIGSDYSKVSAGSEFSVALKTDGSLWTWGNNENGQLGNGTNVDTNVPTMR